MFNRLCLSLLFILFSSPVIMAQQGGNTPAPSALYAELGANAGLSLNLDQIFYTNDGGFKSSFRLGAGVIPIKLNGVTSVIPTVPLELLGFYGKANKHFEFGGGYTHHFSGNPSVTNSYLTGRLGFRYQNLKGGNLFRFSIIPLLYKDHDSIAPGLTLSPGFGVSYGRSF